MGCGVCGVWDMGGVGFVGEMGCGICGVWDMGQMGLWGGGYEVWEL